MSPNLNYEVKFNLSGLFALMYPKTSFKRLEITHGVQPRMILVDNFFVFLRLLLARLHEVQKSYCSHHGRTRSRSRSTLLKFSRSLYLGNHSSESIHTWTIGTPGSMPGGGARGHNLEHLQKVGFCGKVF